MIRPMLTFAAETWSLNQLTETKLLRLENNTLKSICGPVYAGELNIWRRRYTREVRDLIPMPQVTDYIRSSRLRWLGHILRSGQDRFTSRVFTENIVGRRPRRRPRTGWKNGVENDLRSLDVDPDEIDMLAADRRVWRHIVLAARGLNGPVVPEE
ncbi:uncharacterized protein LOC143023489 [Oratosquilla oratoria]|uniref:uncharacterized protein LOC143023489 n=1 Tax=Oratosquilla oratoria TaxID=337810 RepID=UPI003F769DB8